MRLTDRILRYIELKGLTVHAFERSLDIGNGYLGKQGRGKGSVGSEILEKIAEVYPDLSLTWLITGQGKMLQRPLRDSKNHGIEGITLKEERTIYAIRTRLIEVLREQLKTLESSLPKRVANQKQTRKKS